MSGKDFDWDKVYDDYIKDHPIEDEDKGEKEQGK